MNRELSYISKLKVFFLAMIAFYTMLPYFFWSKAIVILFFVAMALFFFFLNYFFGFNEAKITKQSVIQICGFAVLYLYLFILRANNIGYVVVNVLWHFIPVMICILLSQNERKFFLEFLLNFLAIVIGISFLFYLLYILNVLHLPETVLTDPVGDDRTFRNFRFFINIVDKREINLFFRFQAIFREPGHLGMFCAILLYIGNYNFRKKRNIIFLLGLIFSLSLSGYVLLVIGLICRYFFSRESLTQRFIFCVKLVVISLVVVVSCVIYYKAYPDSLFSHWVLSRFELDEEKGIKGNNRESSQFDRVYESFLDTGGLDYFIGVGTEAETYHSASYKVYLYQRGLLGLIVLLVFYGAVLLSDYSSMKMGLFILYVASFIQRPYALWSFEIFLFICYQPLLIQKERKIINNNKSHNLSYLLKPNYI